MRDIKITFSILILIWILYQFLNLTSGRIGSKIEPKFISYVRKYIIEEVIDRHKNNYDDLKTGEILTKIINSPYILFDVFSTVRSFLFSNLFFIISTFIYLFYHNKILGITYLFCIGLVALVCYKYTQTCEKKVINSEVKYDETHEEIDDTLSNLISIYTSKRTNEEKIRLGMFSTETSNKEIELNRCNNNFKIMYSILFVFIFIVLNVLSFGLYLKNKFKIGTLVSVVIINYSILTTLMSIYYDTRFFIDTKGRLDILKKFLNKFPKKDNTKYDKKIENKLDKYQELQINIKNLHFSYGDKKVLDNINVSFPKITTALIGGIGSGKSTLSKLIVRLRDYKEGKIMLNDIEINKIPIEKLRSIIGYIPQHPKLFNRTLYDNINYGLDKKVSIDKIYQVLRKNNLTDIIEDFKRLMTKKVGKNGSLLSGGQRQIVWILRFIFNNHKIVILDEPTSSLDNKNKLNVISLIKELEKTKTIILITHDNELLKYTKRIIELKKGQVISDNFLK